jgi:hypothetical protein
MSLVKMSNKDDVKSENATKPPSLCTILPYDFHRFTNYTITDFGCQISLGWQIEQKNMHKGRISINQENIQSGHYSLELTPNDGKIQVQTF